MTADIVQTLGGIGLFLLGMIWLTEGLRGLAGSRLRNALARFTRTPFSGAVAGSVATAALQSSSATTVTAIGFVSAGLLTFPQALGIIFGANVGTTLTGWLVAVLGFKLHLGEVVLPLVLVGALLRLLSRGWLSMLGMAFAGFSLLFIGIDAMRAGMAGFEGVVTPSVFPADSLTGRLQLVLIGIAITVVTQSSSAGVATALAALGAGAINFPQAAAMVIGMDVGTTFTAALASIGGSTAARRTGLSHVIYNLLTGIMAFLLLGPFTLMVAPLIAGGDDQIGLVAFHSGFNILGVVLVLPFTRLFAKLIVTLVPEEAPQLTRRLDRHLLKDADAATDAVVGTIEDLRSEEFSLLCKRLAQARSGRVIRLDSPELSDALQQTRQFIEGIATDQFGSPRSEKLVVSLHILDHLERLLHRMERADRLRVLRKDARLLRLSGLLQGAVGKAIGSEDFDQSEARLNKLRRLLISQHTTYRETLLVSASTGRLDVAAVPMMLDTLRWIYRVGYHVWRIEHHFARLKNAGTQTPSSKAKAEAVDDL